MGIKTRLISILSSLRKPVVELSLADPSLRRECLRLFVVPASSGTGGPMRPTNSVLRLSLSICLFLLVCSSVFGQIAGGGDDVATPIPGAGHDYIHLLSETVSPENGTVSVNIKLPTAAGRGISFPFSLIYNSGLANHFYTDSIGGAYFSPDWGGMFRGGWNNSLPLLTYQAWVLPWSPPPHISPGNCYYSTGYTFYDSAGAGHALGLATTSPPVQLYDYCSGISSIPGGFTSYNYGGDSQVKAAFIYPCGDNPGGTGCELGAPPLKVFDAGGTIYSFPNYGGGSSADPITQSYWPSSIEDRNGNIINVSLSSQSAPTFMDTAGRTLVSLNNPTNGQYGWGFAPTVIVADGLTYNLSYTTATSNFSMPAQSLTSPGGYNCGYASISESSQGGPLHVVSTITLPNNQTYTFYYDPTYGLLNEIVYPDGGWVKYTWKPSDFYSEAAAFDVTVSGAIYQDGCNILYKTPVVATRQVGFTGGTIPALTQTFTYSTNWNGLQWTSKSTTVQTTDNITGKTSQAVYTYQSYTPPLVPNTHQWIATQIALEKQTKYYDWGNITNPIRTVAKMWFDPFEMASQQTTLDNNQTSLVSYQYGFGGAVGQKSEYDFGNGAAGTLLRKTVTNFQSFPFNPAWPQSVYPPSIQQSTLLASPCQTLVYDGSGSGNPVAETDFLYDGGTTVCGTAGTPSVSGVSNLPAGTHDETYYGTSSTVSRGNATRVTHKCFTSCSADSVTTYVFDETGQILSVTDPCGNAACSDMPPGANHTTTFSYADSYDSPPSSNTNAYLTKITNPLGQYTRFKYAYADGQLISSTDPNGLVTGYLYGDSLRRLTETDRPDGGSTVLTYNDVPPTPSVTTATKLNTTTTKTSVAISDGMGHVNQTQLTSDPQGTTYVDTTYDGLGRVATVSNPHRTCGTDPTSSCGATTYFYDVLGRKCLEVPPDGTLPTGSTCPTTRIAGDIFTAYKGNTVTVVDQTNRSRKSVSDSLGRLTQIFEDPAGLNYETDYSYDALGNLTGVSQKGGSANATLWRVRTFTYDSLSRLLTSTNPEVATITYTYDANGNVLTKKDARAIITTYGYDALNRELTRTYSNNDPTITTTYDQSTCLGLAACQNIGHRTSMTDAAGSESWAYQQNNQAQYPDRPHILVDKRTIGAVTKTGTYYSDLAGNITQWIYPTGRTIYSSVGGAGRVLQVYNGPQYAFSQVPASPGCPINNVCYTPQGMIYSMAVYHNFSTGFNGLNILETYNSRLQPQEIKASSSGGNAMDLIYNYTDPINGGNAGHVFQTTNNLDNTRTQNFTYDQLNRLTSAGTASTVGGHCWGYLYAYDPWGNLTSQAGWTPNYNGCSQTVMGAVTADANNHISAFSYDAAGNASGESGYTYNWDAESQLKSVSGTFGSATYLYDGDGRRVSEPHLLWYGPDGNILAFTDGSGNVYSEYVYLGSRRIAILAGTNVTPISSDSLGSARILTDGTGVVIYDADFTPYGGERAYTQTSYSIFKFEGKQRDFSTTQNDYFGARYYSNRFGRWLNPDWTVDPEPVPFGDLTNPQTLNLYAFVHDDPESFIDMDGHNPFDDLIGWLGELKRWFTSGRSSSEKHQEPSILDLLQAFRNAHGNPELQRYFLGRILGIKQVSVPGSQSQNSMGPGNVVPIPMNVIKLLEFLDSTGQAPPNTEGGRTFLNDGRGGGEVLPNTDAGGSPISYREWDVNPSGPRGRDAERVVTGSDGSAYYTDNHYQTFRKVR